MSQVVILDGGEKKMSWDKLCEKNTFKFLLMICSTEHFFFLFCIHSALNFKEFYI